MSTDPTVTANKTTIKTTVTTAFTPIGPALKPESVFVTLANRQVTVQASYPFAPLAARGLDVSCTPQRNVPLGAGAVMLATTCARS